MISLNIIKNKNDEEIASQIASAINEQLKLGQKVLWFVTGGSSIPMQILIAKKIKKTPESKLVITLTDERYGDNNHQESNWFKLKTGGFTVAGAKLIPILSNKNISETTEDFIKNLESELNETDYKIGLFGIGADGHTAGILPHSQAVDSEELAYSYDAPPFERITITPKTILKLDQAFVYAMGETKWPVIKKLKKEFPVNELPAQILKKIPLLTIFTDNKK
jgi:6-phosphogluconolactonase/glucosamine-6-phosphate isomerase/deaminase